MHLLNLFQLHPIVHFMYTSLPLSQKEICLEKVLNYGMNKGCIQKIPDLDWFLASLFVVPLLHFHISLKIHIHGDFKVPFLHSRFFWS